MPTVEVRLRVRVHTGLQYKERVTSTLLMGQPMVDAVGCEQRESEMQDVV